MIKTLNLIDIDNKMNIYQYIESMDIILMQRAAGYNIIDFKGSEIATISSFQQLFNLYMIHYRKIKMIYCIGYG